MSEGLEVFLVKKKKKDQVICVTYENNGKDRYYLSLHWCQIKIKSVSKLLKLSSRLEKLK